MAEDLLYEVKNRVAFMTIHREASRNAISQEMITAFLDDLDRRIKTKGCEPSVLQELGQDLLLRCGSGHRLCRSGGRPVDRGEEVRPASEAHGEVWKASPRSSQRHLRAGGLG